ncbi:hypothetical protein IC582_008698 [Cucumis melo]|uniref:Uncharacterized protein LOC103502684 isoform X1 n=2 Tax=Cucumis melo TaxID=3656 RepID=A0A1S3CML7_CUCME|nr:SAGA-associated factor 29 homolog A isoform X1 [Cucumis melo]XP_008464932.1 SAGA-associated factor 29 homolog A isoform X1 [Cucumis melo]KAA0057239.1 SAGA-associated factor 29-like protein [Cucumis melo var. makuwa]TYK18722.1 SAGA-associated factor 29-like protein [Cucumis melo var. makuwa]
MSSFDIDGILGNTKELDRLRKEQEVVVLEINKMHKKLLATPKVVEKPGDNSLSKLKHLYTQAKQLSEDEVSVSTTLLGQLETLLPGPVQQRRKIDKKRMKADSDNARSSPAMRNLEACANMKDEQVAARVTPDGAEKDEWFIVKVIHFDKETKLFEVLDEEPGDEDEGGGQRKYKLPMSAIISFPKRNDPSTVPEFLPGRRVLAVYPGTTALYRATVVNSHRKRKTDDYLLEFDDDEEDGSSTLPQRTVPFHKVVALPEGLRQ